MKQSTGHVLGYALLATSAACSAAAVLRALGGGQSSPLSTAGGGDVDHRGSLQVGCWWQFASGAVVSLFSGRYFLTRLYLNDPEAVAQYRRKIQLNGLEYALTNFGGIKTIAKILQHHEFHDLLLTEFSTKAPTLSDVLQVLHNKFGYLEDLVELRLVTREYLRSKFVADYHAARQDFTTLVLRFRNRGSVELEQLAGLGVMDDACVRRAFLRHFAWLTTNGDDGSSSNVDGDDDFANLISKGSQQVPMLQPLSGATPASVSGSATSSPSSVRDLASSPLSVVYQHGEFAMKRLQVPRSFLQQAVVSSADGQLLSFGQLWDSYHLLELFRLGFAPQEFCESKFQLELETSFLISSNYPEERGVADANSTKAKKKKKGLASSHSGSSTVSVVGQRAVGYELREVNKRFGVERLLRTGIIQPAALQQVFLRAVPIRKQNGSPLSGMGMHPHPVAFASEQTLDEHALALFKSQDCVVSFLVEWKQVLKEFGPRILWGQPPALLRSLQQCYTEWTIEGARVFEATVVTVPKPTPPSGLEDFVAAPTANKPPTSRHIFSETLAELDRRREKKKKSKQHRNNKKQLERKIRQDDDGTTATASYCDDDDSSSCASSCADSDDDGELYHASATTHRQAEEEGNLQDTKSKKKSKQLSVEERIAVARYEEVLRVYTEEVDRKTAARRRDLLALLVRIQNNFADGPAAAAVEFATSAGASSGRGAGADYVEANDECSLM